jgi:S1-C subfamily serine protease
MLYHKASIFFGFLKKNKLMILLITAAFLGGVIGSSVILPSSSQANILGDIYQNIIRELGFKSTSTVSSSLFGISESQTTVKNDYEQAIIDAVQKASPAVVSIVISKDVPVIEQCPYNPFSDLPEEFQQFFDFGGSQFYQPCQKGTKKQDIGGGSGFIISSDGLIVTNKHVVSDASASYTVLTNDGKKYSAKVLARHPSLDIAMVKISASGMPTIELGDSNGLKLGQTTIAIGNALGEFRNTVSVGIVSGLARTLTASDGFGRGSETLDNVIQTSAAINPGNSGGPLLDLSGRVIGINTAMVSGAQNIGFAIPINVAKKSIESVSSTGEINIAYLGVRYVSLDSETAKNYKVSRESGALIKGDDNNFAVEPGSPADKVGLKEDDIIIKVDNQAVDKSNPLASIIAQKNPGDTITLAVIRDGKEITVSVTLGKRK